MQIISGSGKSMLDVPDQSQYRFQVIPISLAIASAANQMVQFSVQLDRDFNKIVGLGYNEITDGDNGNNYTVGAKTQRQQWIDPINALFWKADNQVGPMEKYYRVNIPYGSGDTFYAQVTPGITVATDALAGQMVLILKRDMTELPK